VPFALNTWPTCEPWERSGEPTLKDRLDVKEWVEQVQLEIALEIDRRFDRLLAHIDATAWPPLQHSELERNNVPSSES
jgi:hypothetical protein